MTFLMIPGDELFLHDIPYDIQRLASLRPSFAISSSEIPKRIRHLDLTTLLHHLHNSRLLRHIIDIIHSLRKHLVRAIHTA